MTNSIAGCYLPDQICDKRKQDQCANVVMRTFANFTVVLATPMVFLSLFPASVLAVFGPVFYPVACGVVTAASIVRAEDFLKDDHRLTRICFVSLMALSMFVTLKFGGFLFPVVTGAAYLLTAALTYAAITKITPLTQFFTDYYTKPELINDPLENGRSTYCVRWNKSEGVSEGNDQSDSAIMAKAFRETIFYSEFNTMIKDLGVPEVKAKVVAIKEQYLLPLYEKLLEVRSFTPPALIGSILNILRAPVNAIGHWIEEKTYPYAEEFQKTSTRIQILVKPIFLCGSIGLALISVPWIFVCNPDMYFEILMGLMVGSTLVVTKDLVTKGDVITRISAAVLLILFCYDVPFIVSATVTYLIFSRVKPINQFMNNYYGKMEPLESVPWIKWGNKEPTFPDVIKICSAVGETQFYNKFLTAYSETGGYLLAKAILLTKDHLLPAWDRIRTKWNRSTG